MSPTDPLDTDAPPRPATHRRRRWLLGLVLLVLVGGAGAVGLDRWRHPQVFGNLGDAFEGDPRPVARASLATTVIFPAGPDDETETVTLRSVEAVFSDNSAGATVTAHVCHMGEGEMPIGMVGDPEAFCADSEPFEAGMPLRHGVAPDSDYLYVTITPARPGVAVLERVEVGYARGGEHLFQRGVESIAVRRTITAT